MFCPFSSSSVPKIYNFSFGFSIYATEICFSRSRDGGKICSFSFFSVRSEKDFDKATDFLRTNFNNLVGAESVTSGALISFSSVG